MTISSLGLGSGIDAESIISSLLAVERKPLTALETQEKGIKTKVSSFGQLQSLFSDLQTASRDLASSLLWSQTTATSSAPASVAVSTGSGAPLGAFSVSVADLAVAQTATSRAFASSSDTLNAGTLTIELGSWTGDPVSGFTAKAGSTPLTITIADGETSLAKIRDKINAAGAGVTASIVNDASGARLSLISKDTGVENGFRITAAEGADDGDPTTGLSALAYDPVGGASQLTLNQAARNATATINGIAVTSASNTLANVVEGMTLTLLDKTMTNANISVASDTEAVKSGVDAFVKAFNALASYIRAQTKYDPASKNAGPLQGDRTAIGLQNQLRAVLNQATTASSVYTRLSDIGLVMKADGSLETKSSKLTEALSSPDKLAELRKLFGTEGADDASSGFMVRYRNLAAAVLGTEGSLTTVTESLNGRIEDLRKREDALKARLVSTEARLRQQYQALDDRMATLGGLSSYVGAQLRSLY
jgi:flagellar hook-associated protein 2